MIARFYLGAFLLKQLFLITDAKQILSVCEFLVSVVQMDIVLIHAPHRPETRPQYVQNGGVRCVGTALLEGRDFLNDDQRLATTPRQNEKCHNGCVIVRFIVPKPPTPMLARP